MVKPLPLIKKKIFFVKFVFLKLIFISWLNLCLLAKLLPFNKTFIFSYINLKTILLTRHFDHPIDLTI
jgi:hypothetical protein